MTAPDPTPLRDRLVTALRECRCPLPSFQADAVLAVVQPRWDAMDAEIRHLRDLHGVHEAARLGSLIGLDEESAVAIRGVLAETEAELHRYRSAWLSARRRAEAWRGEYVTVAEQRADWDERYISRALYDQNVRAVHKRNERVVWQLCGEQQKAEAAEAERDRAMAGVPLICSDDRHQAKVRGLEAERDQLRAELRQHETCVCGHERHHHQYDTAVRSDYCAGGCTVAKDLHTFQLEETSS